VWGHLRLIIKDALSIRLRLPLVLGFLEGVLVLISRRLDCEVGFDCFSQADLFFIIDGLGKRIQLLLF